MSFFIKGDFDRIIVFSKDNGNLLGELSNRVLSLYIDDLYVDFNWYLTKRQFSYLKPAYTFFIVRTININLTSCTIIFLSGILI
jgi:hypothetical protein